MAVDIGLGEKKRTQTENNTKCSALMAAITTELQRSKLTVDFLKFFSNIGKNIFSQNFQNK